MDLTEAIAAYLQRRRCLVVLDNCEHVLDAVVGLARRLLGLEGVAVLATSREVLGVDDEQLWPVPPLEEAAAVELFVDRCRHRDPGFSVDGDTAEAIREISRRVDGIPLALELAAGRTTALSPRAIAERLDDRFRLLRGGRRGERHQTLRDTVQWSYDLLSPAEAALFDRLCVFVGGFTVEAVEAVCSDESLVDELDVVDLLVALVDKSMVQRDRSRQGPLHDAGDAAPVRRGAAPRDAAGRRRSATATSASSGASRWTSTGARSARRKRRRGPASTPSGTTSVCPSPTAREAGELEAAAESCWLATTSGS